MTPALRLKYAALGADNHCGDAAAVEQYPHPEPAFAPFKRRHCKDTARNFLTGYLRREVGCHLEFRAEPRDRRRLLGAQGERRDTAYPY